MVCDNCKKQAPARMDYSGHRGPYALQADGFYLPNGTKDLCYQCHDAGERGKEAAIAARQVK